MFLWTALYVSVTAASSQSMIRRRQSVSLVLCEPSAQDASMRPASCNDHVICYRALTATGSDTTDGQAQELWRLSFNQAFELVVQRQCLRTARRSAHAPYSRILGRIAIRLCSYKSPARGARRLEAATGQEDAKGDGVKTMICDVASCLPPRRRDA